MNVRMTKFIVSVAVAIMSAMSAVAQPYCSVRTFNIRDGLPANNVSTIAQSKDGLIWASTWNGLCYYDGYNFETFRSSPENGWLPTNRILMIKPNSNGDIWLITYDRQLYLFDTSESKFININSTLKTRLGTDFEARNIYSTPDGHTWVIGHGRRTAVRINDNAPTVADSMEVYGLGTAPVSNKANSYVRKVETDAAGREWVFYDNCVSLYGTKIAAEGAFEHIASVGDDTFLATGDGAIYVMRPGAKELNPVNSPADRTRINTLQALDDNTLLIGTNRGIYVRDKKKTSSLLIEVGEPMTPAANVTDIFVDSKKRIWAFTSADGIVLTDASGKKVERFASLPDSKGTPGSRLPIWLEDNSGTIWFVPRGGVFSYFDELDHRIVSCALQSPHFGFADVPEIERFFIDANNNLWLSSFHDLVLVNFKYHDVRRVPFVKNQETRSLLALENGNIWAGTASGYIGVFDSDGRLLHYIVRNGDRIAESTEPRKFADKIYSMFEDSRGTIWVGTKGAGLFTISGDRLNHYMPDASDRSAISCDAVYSVDEDEKGNIWIGTYGGGLNLAVRQADGTYKFLNKRNGLSTYPLDRFENIRRITHDGKGVVIVSTTTGLLTFSNRFNDPSSIAYFPTTGRTGDETSLRTSNVMQALATRSGDIFVSTMGGELQRIMTPDLLQPQLPFESDSKLGPGGAGKRSVFRDGNVLSMIDDKAGNIYIVRDGSMSVYSPETDEIISLGPNELGEYLEFTEALPAVAPADGRIWLGAVGGMISVLPSEIIRSDFSPNIVFTKLTYQGESDGLSLLHHDRIDLPSDRRNVAVQFAAVDYSADASVQYAYRLRDNGEWTYIGNSNTAYLSHLSPGRHYLEVKSTNADGVWCDNVTVLEIYAEPTFWETSIAKILYILFGLLLVYGVLHIYMLRRKNALHSELDRMKTRFFADVSHKLRTPLTLISAPVREVLKEPELKPESRKHLEKVVRNSDNMLELVNKMLRWSQDNGVYISDENRIETVGINDIRKYPQDHIIEPDLQTVPGAKNVRLLIVEDNDDLRNFLRDILAPNYTVYVAENGKQGLKMAEEIQPDFIITDVMMPEMDGLTMVHNIKQNKSLSHIPIIVLSAKASVSDRVQGLREGIDDYITKPFSPSYLKQRIANIILQRRMLQHTYLEMIQKRPQLPEAPEKTDQTGQTSQTEEAPVGLTEDNLPAQTPEQTASQWRLDAPVIADADQEMMSKLLKFLEARIDDENLKIEELAEAVNLGRTVFYGKVKSLVGMSPSDFLRHIRMQRAADLIAGSKLNFSQIAFNVGFSDPKYFTKCFKKETGMTPSEYRAHAKRKKDASESM